MPAEDVAAIGAVLAEQRPRLVVEWGCGGSTLRFGAREGIECWHSIEHDPAWAERVSAAAPDCVAVHLLPLDSPDYVLLPQRRGFMPDLILVDGRRRNECLRLSRAIVAPSGVVLLHDACRRRYEDGMSVFTRRRVLTRGCSDTLRVDSERSNGLYWHQGVTALYL